MGPAAWTRGKCPARLLVDAGSGVASWPWSPWCLLGCGRVERERELPAGVAEFAPIARGAGAGAVEFVVEVGVDHAHRGQLARHVGQCEPSVRPLRRVS